jgi:acyl carrier protein
MEQTEGEVRKVLAEVLSELGVDPDSVADSATLGADLELDSTDAVEIGLELKRHFSVAVKVQVKGGETLGDLVKLVTGEIHQAGD